LDAPEQIHGAALETLFLQQVRAFNDYAKLGYRLHYWRTTAGEEVDFVLYGERGLCAFELKMGQTIRPDDLRTLQRFQADFPQARVYLLYLGTRSWHEKGVEVLPVRDCLAKLHKWL
jgi:predicted AAA+ superfamily ATPase